MNQEPLSIKKERPKYVSMDYHFLRDMGMRAAQRLSGKIWTDFNPHDPGITILEQLCFALTDLGFRTDFTMQDLLNARTIKGKNQPRNTFFDASEILPANPLTIDDYRVLIIDRVPYIKNAWFECVKDNYLAIQGLYRVLLQVNEAARTPDKLRLIKNEVLEVFAAHRNLGEDIDNIEILEVDKIVVYADLEIASEAIAEEVLATIQFRINEYLNPTIKFYTVEELQAEGKTIDEIFDGPMPKHGFIKKEELLPMRQEIYSSKIIEIITSVEGVRRVTYFNVEKNDFAIEGDVIQIDKGFYPVLDMDALDKRFTPSNYPVQFYRGGLDYELDLHTASQLLHSQFARYKKGYEQKKLYNAKDYPSILKRDEIIQYFSIQHTFPLTYGLNPFGLLDNVRPSRERLAAIKQLRAYLIPFEQIMANYLAQLAHIKELFSIDMEVDRTYYSQVPTDVPFYEEMFKVSFDKSNLGDDSADEYRRRVAAAFAEQLDILAKKFDPFIERRNRFLDHLLARFSEQYSTDFLLKVSSSYIPAHAAEQTERELINAKIRFLQNYIDISRNRGAAFNYFESDDSLWNVSGLEKRVCLLLNIAQDSNASLLRIFDNRIDQVDIPAFSEVVDFIAPDALPQYIQQADENTTEEPTAEEPKRPTIQPEEDNNLNYLLDEELPTNPETGDDNFTAPSVAEEADFANKFVFRADSRSNLLLELLAHAIFAYNYIVLPENNGASFAIYYCGNKAIGNYKVRTVDSRLAARRAIDELTAYLLQVNKYSEGFHLVEHQLLRPQAKDQHFFVLNSDRDLPMLRSYQLGEQNEQRYISEDIPALGAVAENYEIQPFYGQPEAQRVLKKSRREEPPKEDDNFSIEEENPFDETTQSFLDKLNSDEPKEEDAPPVEEEQPPLAAEPLEYHLLLKDQYGRYVARAPHGFATPAEAQEFANDVIDYILSFTKGNASIFDKIIYDVKPRVQATVRDTFYSQEVSIVMPNWTTRFQNADFRNLLRNAVIVNTPVHLHINFFWIGVEEMEDFERATNEWLYERIAIEPRQPQLDEKGLVLTELLGQYLKIAEAKKEKTKKKR